MAPADPVRFLMKTIWLKWARGGAGHRKINGMSRENISGNQPVISGKKWGQNMLDNPKTFTYHTQAFATGLTFGAAKKVFAAAELSRGADLHDE